MPRPTITSDQLPERFSLSNGSLSLPGLDITFHRTLRVGDNGVNALPPGLGRFPLRAVRSDDLRLPDQVRACGGAVMPMYVREAMWMSFDASEPLAIQIGTGGICVLTGKDLRDRLLRRPQNYVVATEQPWLDGYKTASGEVRQFVGVPAGSGLSVEAQSAPGRSVGGIQIQVWRLTPEALEAWRNERRWFADEMADFCMSPAPSAAMEIGAGGRIRQEVYRDEFAKRDWRGQPSARVWLHPVPIPTWTAWTGEPAPSTPVDTEAYVRAGLPWFDYYDESKHDVDSTAELEGIRSVGELTGLTEPVHVPTDSPRVIGLADLRQIELHPGTWHWTA